jgi:hypothetical protein
MLAIAAETWRAPARAGKCRAAGVRDLRLRTTQEQAGRLGVPVHDGSCRVGHDDRGEPSGLRAHGWCS